MNNPRTLSCSQDCIELRCICAGFSDPGSVHSCVGRRNDILISDCTTVSHAAAPNSSLRRTDVG
jgi:hypothetical protein